MSEQAGTAIVAGVGAGLGRALCGQLAGAGFCVAGLARGTEAGRNLVAELGSDRFMMGRCDLSDATQVDRAVRAIEEQWGPASVYVHNAAPFHAAPFAETKPDIFESVWRTTCLGAVHGSQRVLPGMLQRGAGVLLFVGATASVKAGAGFSAFGSAKSALRGLAQSLARELGPRGIHVAHLVIDGVIWGERADEDFGMTREQCLEPAAVAGTCLHLIGQERSAWTHELDIRPDRERF